jgi:hypothetical protein
VPSNGRNSTDDVSRATDTVSDESLKKVAPDMSDPSNQRTLSAAAGSKDTGSLQLPQIEIIRIDNLENALKNRSWLGIIASPKGKDVDSIIEAMNPTERYQFEKDFSTQSSDSLRDEMKSYLGESSPEYQKAIGLLDAQDGQTNFTGEFNSAVATAHQDPTKGVSTLRTVLSNMSSAQVANLGSDAQQTVDQIPGISAADRTVLDNLLKGKDKLTADDYKTMATAVVDQQVEQQKFGVSILGTAENLNTLSDVLGSGLPAANDARKQLREDPAFMQKYNTAFKYGFETPAQQSMADDLITRGEITAASVAEGDTFFGLLDSKTSIESAALNAGDQTRKDFALGQELSKAGKSGDNESQKTALAFYQKVDSAFKNAGNAQQVRIWEDEIANGKRTQGFINEAANDPNSTISEIADALQHASPDEAKALHDESSDTRAALDKAMAKPRGIGPGDAAANILASSLQRGLEQSGTVTPLNDTERLAAESIADPRNVAKSVMLAEALVQDPALRQRLSKAYDQFQRFGWDMQPPGVTGDDARLVRNINSLVPADYGTVESLLSSGKVPDPIKFEYMNVSSEPFGPISNATGHYEELAGLQHANLAFSRVMDPEQHAILQRTIANGGKLDDVDRIRSFVDGDGTSYKALPDLSKLSQAEMDEYHSRFNANLKDDVILRLQKDDSGAVPIVVKEFNPTSTNEQRQIDQMQERDLSNPSSPDSIGETASLTNGQKLIDEFGSVRNQLPPDAQQKLDSLAQQYADMHKQKDVDKEKEEALLRDVLLTVASVPLSIGAAALFRAAFVARAAQVAEGVAVVDGATEAPVAAAEVAAAPAAAPEVVAPELVTPTIPSEVVAPELVAPTIPPEVVAPEVVAPTAPPELVVPELAATAAPPEVVTPELTAPAAPPEVVTPELAAPAAPAEVVVPELAAPAAPPEVVTPELAAPAALPEVVTSELTGPVDAPEVVAPEVAAPAIAEVAAPEVVAAELAPAVVAPDVAAIVAAPEVVAPLAAAAVAASEVAAEPPKPSDPRKDAAVDNVLVAVGTQLTNDELVKLATVRRGEGPFQSAERVLKQAYKVEAHAKNSSHAHRPSIDEVMALTRALQRVYSAQNGSWDMSGLKVGYKLVTKNNFQQVLHDVLTSELSTPLGGRTIKIAGDKRTGIENTIDRYGRHS